MTSGCREALRRGEGRVTATAGRPAPWPSLARASPRRRPRAAATSRSRRHGARAPPPPSPPARLAAAAAAAGAAASGAARSHGREPRLGEPPHQELQEQGPRCGGECAPGLAGPGGWEGRGGGPRPLALAGWRSVGVGRRLGAPRPGQQTPSERLAPRLGPLSARPRCAGAAWRRRGRDVEPRRGPRAAREDGPGCCRPACRPHRRGRAGPPLVSAAGAASSAAAHGASVPAPTLCEPGPGGRWQSSEGGGDQPGN